MYTYSVLIYIPVYICVGTLLSQNNINDTFYEYMMVKKRLHIVVFLISVTMKTTDVKEKIYM